MIFLKKSGRSIKLVKEKEKEVKVKGEREIYIYHD